ncbi:MAG: subclass B3 metallo-beta-lactamase [bacterium]
MRHATRILFLLFALTPAAAHAQTPDSAQAFNYSAAACPSCAEWNAPQKPLRIYGNTWYVGTHGLSAVLITSPQGHVLIDAGLPASAPQIIANIRTLGFRVEDVKFIVNSHAHYDHAGGIAELQRASGAVVAASPASAPVIRSGKAGQDDPQYRIAFPYAPTPTVRTIADGETLRVGPVALTAHFTPGHTPGGTSWGWQSCENSACMDMVYADSQTPVSADGFFFTRSKEYPTAISDFEHGFGVLEQLRCDILITPHPDASSLWQRLDARDHGNSASLVDREACKRYVARAREALARRIKAEQ